MSSFVSGPDALQIPRPIKLEYRRGLASLRSSGRAVAVRIHEDDLEMLAQEAALLNITRGELMRWLSVYGGAALHFNRTGKRVYVTP